MCVFMYIYKCMYVYMCLCMYVCKYIYMYVYMYVCMYVCMYVNIYIYIKHHNELEMFLIEEKLSFPLKKKIFGEKSSSSGIIMICVAGGAPYLVLCSVGGCLYM